MLVDEAKIEIKAGNGGNGGVYFRHEKYVPKGGPDGGDGGDGGDVIIKPDVHVADLSEYARKRYFVAPDGGNGKPRLCSGRDGEDLELLVPFGTQIYSKGELVADFVNIDDVYLAAKGGNGGWGNHHFATSIKQAPQWAKDGLPGENKELKLELKIIADVGLIGLPNAGKSTLLSVLSNAKPKIASYPFTTLEPNLGAVKTPEKSLIIADIPGLIEGASHGKGLGHKFLKHIERTKIIVHLVSADSPDPIKDYFTVRHELEEFSSELAKKSEIVLISKSEIAGEQQLADLVKLFKKKKIEVTSVSAATHENIDEVIFSILNRTK